jgi:TPR repeat protein
MGIRSIAHYCLPCWIKSDDQLAEEQKEQKQAAFDPQQASDAFRQGERLLFVQSQKDIESGVGLLEARKKFELSSENRHALGSAVAGIFHECAIAEAKPDFKRAHQYYEISAELGDPLGKCLLASMPFRVEAGAIPGDYKQRKVLLKEATGLGFRGYGQDPLKWLKEAADSQGVGEAIFLLASCIEQGVGVQRADPFTAVGLYTKAAEMGIKSARRELAKCFLSGRGTEKNSQSAKFWLERAIQGNGDPESMALLAVGYERGLFWSDSKTITKANGIEVSAAMEAVNKQQPSTEQKEPPPQELAAWQLEPEILERLENPMKMRIENRDFRECYYWANRSSQMGSAAGTYQLARCYEQGLGVAISIDQAIKFYEEATRMGSAAAQFSLACFYCATEAKKDLKKAHELLEKAAQAGYTPAMVSLATLYTLQSKCHIRLMENGAVDRFRYTFKTSLFKQRDQLQITMSMNDEDLKVAMQWWRRAAKRNSIQAQYELALCYRDGRGTAVDVTKALFWMRTAAQAGLAEAQLELGVLLVQDLPLHAAATLECDNESFYWILRAAKNGLPEAQIELAQLFVEGKYVHRNPSTAFYWFKRAAKAGHPFAQFRVGAMLLDNETANGCVSVQDSQGEAVRWLKLASEQGWADADSLLPIAFGMANEQASLQ